MRINAIRFNRFVILVALFLLVFQMASAQTVETPEPRNQHNDAATEREVKEFFDSYAEDLRQHRREAIANRYDPRGVFFLGNGEKIYESFEAVKNRYLTSQGRCP